MFGMGTAVAEVTALPIDFSGGEAAHSDCFLSDLEYEDESIQVRIEKGRKYETNYWVAYITVADPSQIRTVSADGFDSESVMSGTVLAKRVNAILAVNGDYFSYSTDGYIVREGILYRDVPNRFRDTLMIDENGDFILISPATDENLEPYRQANIINSFNFGPALVIDGVIRDPIPNNNQVMANDNRQRLCIAQTGELSYLCIASEGPADSGSKGLTLKQLAQLAFDLGAEQAYNLDGGNSTMMIFNGQKINAVDNENVRDISDIVYFASADK